MSHLPPQDPNNDPHIQGAGHPRNTPIPVPYGRYNPSMGPAPVSGSGWNDPVLREVQRKRSATRKISLSSGIIGIITMIIQMIVTTTFSAAITFPGAQHQDLEFTLLDSLALLMLIFAPFIVGLGWIATFILALIACIRAHSRTPRVQPDGWVEAKMPTSALLAASIVAGLPTLIMYVTWPSDASESLLVACGLSQLLIAVGFAFLLLTSKALDPAVRESQAPGTQPA